MKFPALILAALWFAAGATPDALAQDDPCCDPCVRYTTKTVERTVEIPATMRTVRTPVFECVDVPVYGVKRTPVYREVRIPIWKTRQVPVYRMKRTPRYKDVEVPVYAMRSVPLTREVCDPCTGEKTTVPCGCRQERYQSGTRTVRTLDGYDTERVECGTRCERYEDGFETKRVACGEKVERVEVGTRKVRRFKEWKCEQVVVCPARTVTVRECVRVPCER